QTIVPHRTIGVADNAFGISAAIESAERAITERVVQLAQHAPVRIQLNFEVVAEQPRGPSGICQVGLLREVPAILDPAGELRLFAAVAQFDSRRLAVGRGAGKPITKLADLRAAAEVPVFFRHEVDSGGAREAGLSAALIALLEVHAGAVGESSLHSGNQVSLADLRAVVRALVFQRVVEIKIGQIGIEKGGADFSTRPEVSVG